MTDARRILALLANPRVREVFARAVLGEQVTPTNSAQRRALERLVEAGLLVPREGAFEAPVGPWEAALAALPRRPNRSGLSRFVEDDRIVQYPANPEARVEVLEWVVARVLQPDEVLDERSLGERLARHTDDVAVLRRYLVDAGLLLRTRSGSSYGRAPAE